MKVPGYQQSNGCHPVLMKLMQWCQLLRRRKGGQGLVEYTFVIAFVCLMVAVCFSLANGSLFYALSQSHSRIVGEFDNINNRTEQYSH